MQWGNWNVSGNPTASYCVWNPLKDADIVLQSLGFVLESSKSGRSNRRSPCLSPLIILWSFAWKARTFFLFCFNLNFPEQFGFIKLMDTLKAFAYRIIWGFGELWQLCLEAVFFQDPVGLGNITVEFLRESGPQPSKPKVKLPLMSVKFEFISALALGRA